MRNEARIDIASHLVYHNFISIYITADFQRTMAKWIGHIIYIATNIYLLYEYLPNIYRYFEGSYNYDGFRYLIPLVIADISFIVSLIILLFATKIKYIITLLILCILHNFTVGFGVEGIPFYGTFIAILSIAIAITKMYAGSDRAKSKA